MSDYISREDAMAYLPQYKLNASDEYAHGFLAGFEYYKGLLKGCPAADVVKQKKGRWKYNPIKDMQEAGFPDAWECSECRTTFPFYNRYCPGCGAEMERDEWDEWNMERWKRIRRERHDTGHGDA